MSESYEWKDIIQSGDNLERGIEVDVRLRSHQCRVQGQTWEQYKDDVAVVSFT